MELCFRKLALVDNSIRDELILQDSYYKNFKMVHELKFEKEKNVRAGFESLRRRLPVPSWFSLCKAPILGALYSSEKISMVKVCWVDCPENGHGHVFFLTTCTCHLLLAHARANREMFFQRWDDVSDDSRGRITNVWLTSSEPCKAISLPLDCEGWYNPSTSKSNLTKELQPTYPTWW